jgi:hypothetical protein
MIDLNQFLTISGLAGFLMILLQAFKRQTPPAVLPYVPYIASALGIVCALLFAFSTGNITTLQSGVSYGVTGLLAGLSSVGLYQHTLDKLH